MYGGYGDGALTNKAAGVGIFIVRKFREEKVVKIEPPEAWLQGRAGMIRCRGKREDVIAVVGCPRQTRARSRLKQSRKPLLGSGPSWKRRRSEH